MRKIVFTSTEKEKIVTLFEDGMGRVELVKIFRCSHRPIVRFLIEELGSEEYTKLAKEHIRKNNQLRPNAKERKWTKESKDNFSKQTIGRYAEEKHWNWNGGISKIEFEKAFGISKEEWKILAQKIRIRDKFICQYCGRKRVSSIHHIIPRRVKIDNHPDNLITLCRRCHPKIEKLTEKYLKGNKDPIEIFYSKWSS